MPGKYLTLVFVFGLASLIEGHLLLASFPFVGFRFDVAPLAKRPSLSRLYV